MKVISAAEALRLPSAQLSDDQHKSVEKLLADIDSKVRTSGCMRRNGFDYSTPCNDPAVVFEVVLALRAAGWDVNCQAMVEQPRIPGAQPRLVGYVLTCMPNQAAIEAARVVLQ